MKILLTEKQLVNMTSRIVLEDAPDITKYPMLNKFANLMSDPETAITNALGAEKGGQAKAFLNSLIASQGQTQGSPQIPGVSQPTDSALTSVPNMAPNIPQGKELMNPLGYKYPLSSKYGARWGRQHKGIDISVPSGTPFYSPQDGIVLLAGDTTPNGCGGHIKINHGTVITKFCHIKKWLVKTGDNVKKGQMIGYTGGGPKDPYRGTSTGAHLHYEILNQSGVAMNPLTVQNNLA